MGMLKHALWRILVMIRSRYGGRASRIFQVPNVVPTVAEKRFSGVGISPGLGVLPLASTKYMDGTTMPICKDLKTAKHDVLFLFI
jgi:hypothetical protein